MYCYTATIPDTTEHDPRHKMSGVECVVVVVVVFIREAGG